MLPLDHPDRIQITFDDRRLVANAGLLLPVTLAQHLGLRVNWLTITWTWAMRWGGRTRATRFGTTVTGASYADDTELLTITLYDSSSVTADLST